DHAVLLDETTDAGDFSNALCLGDPVAEVPILNSPQLGEALLRAADHVLIDPSDASRIRPEAGCNPRRQSPRRGTEIFKHPRACPVEVGAVLEDHIDKRDAKE